MKWTLLYKKRLLFTSICAKISYIKIHDW